MMRLKSMLSVTGWIVEEVMYVKPNAYPTVFQYHEALGSLTHQLIHHFD